jgi:hypothetical protein
VTVAVVPDPDRRPPWYVVAVAATLAIVTALICAAPVTLRALWPMIG